MFNKLLEVFVLSVFLVTLTSCATSSEDPNGNAIVEDPTSSSEDISNLEDGAVIVGDDYVSENAQTQGQLSAEQRAKLEALKQDATIYFGFDSENIGSQYVAILQAHAKFLSDNPSIKVIIEGHTDERGTPEYNVALGERRTRAVAQYLMNLGVSIDQLSIVSYGEEKPLDPNHNESAWAKNRRAVITY
ncbi:MAG: peptidoglycan-associated lipoprotein Pal [Succinivibrionaceae bacterium]|nr:peptidoglycan-associated lipoprotein Pal [Succinivibrionaceae bacterium]